MVTPAPKAVECRVCGKRVTESVDFAVVRKELDCSRRTLKGGGRATAAAARRKLTSFVALPTITVIGRPLSGGEIGLVGE